MRDWRFESELLIGTVIIVMKNHVICLIHSCVSPRTLLYTVLDLYLVYLLSLLIVEMMKSSTLCIFWYALGLWCHLAQL